MNVLASLGVCVVVTVGSLLLIAIAMAALPGCEIHSRRWAVMSG